MNYSLRVLITDKSTLTLELLADALKKCLANSPLVDVKLVGRNGRSWDQNPAVVVHDREIEDDWTITTSESVEPMDLDEREYILENVADHPDYQTIASCRRWFYVESEKDYDMEYLHNYAMLVETMKEFPGIYIFEINDIDPVQFPPRLVS